VLSGNELDFKSSNNYWFVGCAW